MNTTQRPSLPILVAVSTMAVTAMSTVGCAAEKPIEPVRNATLEAYDAAYSEIDVAERAAAAVEASAQAEEAAARAKEAAASRAAGVPISAVQLQAAYEQNEIAADLRFKGKTATVTGVIDSVATDILGTPYVALTTDNSFASVMAMFERGGDEKALSRLMKGSTLTVRCTVTRTTLLSVLMDECRIR